MFRKIIAPVLFLHLGFHTFWVLVYCLSLLGMFILIPVIGSYNAFVLGFLGKGVLPSTTTAALLGYIVFSMTGLLSGWIISLFHPKSVWLMASVSVLLTCMLLISATCVRFKYVGVSGLETILPQPTTTGRADADKFRWALKSKYHSAGEVPPYISGKDSIISLSEVQPSLRLLEKDFQLEGGPYVYCNLPPQVWNGLKKQTGDLKYPLLWTTQSDSSGKRLVVSVDLRTDIFNDELVNNEVLTQMLTSMEGVVRKVTGDPNLKLQE